jgi:hypothetical protein
VTAEGEEVSMRERMEAMRDPIRTIEAICVEGEVDLRHGQDARAS